MTTSAALELASSIKNAWLAGGRPDARHALQEHPQLQDAKSIMLDLAYEEYCQRTSAGEQIEADDFCNQFSAIRTSLQCRLEVHHLIDGNPALLAGFDYEAWPEPDDTVCGFHLLEELGRGAIGRVFLAEERSLADRKVVVKLTRAGVHEAQTLSRLDHPHIVPVFSIQKETLSELAVICMPFLGRHTLQDFLDVSFRAEDSPRTFGDALHRLPKDHDLIAPDHIPREAAGRPYIDGVLHLGVALCEALEHTHDRGILHLDLKPSNVLLTNGGSPLLLDFNLSMTGASHLLGGTMPYMSPEQIQAFVIEQRMGPAGLDARSDVYSLGVILYQLLTGVHPFQKVMWRAAPEEVAQKVRLLQRAGAAPASELNPQVSPQISQVLARAMAVDVKDRYASAQEFAAALRRELSWWHRADRYRRAHRWLVLSVAVGVFLTFLTPAMVLTFQEPYVTRQVNRGVRFFEQGESQAAVESLTAALSKGDNHKAFFLRGRARQRLGDFAQAALDFQAAHRDSHDGRYSACRGFCAAALGDDDVAIARYSDAIKEGFANGELYNCLGKSYVALKLAGPAEEAFNTAVELDPSFAIAWHNLAILHHDMNGDPQRAYECISKALETRDPAPTYFVTAAVIHWSLRQPGWMDDVRRCLTDGADQGLNWQDCEGTPFASQLIGGDNDLVDRLKSQPLKVPPPLFRTDPLGDPEITRAVLKMKS